jgi:hypothetical protein
MSNTKPILLELLRELVWIAIATVVAILVMRPITMQLQYRLMIINGILIVLPIMYFRYAIYMRSMMILQPRWLRFFWSVVNLNLFIYILRRQQEFMGIYDSFTIADMGKPLHALSPADEGWLFQYFYTETSIAVVASLTLIVVMTIRFIWSYWQSARTRLNAGDES